MTVGKTDNNKIVLNNDKMLEIFLHNDEVGIKLNENNKMVCTIVVPMTVNEFGVGKHVYWFNEEKKILYIFETEGLKLLRVDLSEPMNLSQIDTNRSMDDEPGLFRSEFFELTDGCLFIYEGGLIKFSGSGQQEWSKEHYDLGWKMKEVNEDYIIYENEEGDNWAYHIVDGTKQDL